MKLKRTGFTLIELLIVVAIIAILAAIAVPNFLEAQTRAKVSRVKADFHGIGVALESYRVDAGTYPETELNAATWSMDGLYHLTSPVAYITSIPRDPFTSRDDARGTTWNQPSWRYEYAAGTPSGGSTGDAWSPSPTVTTIWILESEGPDRYDQFATPGFPRSWGTQSTGAALSYIYDPTNGTRSAGNIFRVGGEAPADPSMRLFCDIVRR